jgi:kynureninase
MISYNKNTRLFVIFAIPMAQITFLFEEKGKEIYQKMKDQGIIVDYREPGVIRVAPAPLYCSFKDVYRFYEILKSF